VIDGSLLPTTHCRRGEDHVRETPLSHRFSFPLEVALLLLTIQKHTSTTSTRTGWYKKKEKIPYKPLD
jgi:hypothetical protein